MLLRSIALSYPPQPLNQWFSGGKMAHKKYPICLDGPFYIVEDK